jgi:hypothetical protein
MANDRPEGYSPDDFDEKGQPKSKRDMDKEKEHKEKGGGCGC